MEILEFLWIEEEFREIGRYSDEGDLSIKVSESFSETSYTMDKLDSLQAELMADYGDVVGYVYEKENEDKAIGWIFHRKVKAESKGAFANPQYTEETRVTVHSKEPRTWVEYFYAEIPKDESSVETTDGRNDDSTRNG